MCTRACVFVCVCLANRSLLFCPRFIRCRWWNTSSTTEHDTETLYKIWLDMNRLNRSTVSCVHLPRLPFIILSQFTCKISRVRRTTAWNVTGSDTKLSLNHPLGRKIMRNKRFRVVKNTNALSWLTKKHTPEHYSKAIVFAAPLDPH